MICVTIFLASCGLNDSLLVCGDSISKQAFDGTGGGAPLYSPLIQAAHVPYSGLVSVAAVSGQTSTLAAPLLAGYMSAASRYPIVTLNWGTNDASNQNVSVSTFQANMETMIQAVLAAKKIPIFQTIPYSPLASLSHVPEYNAALATLRTTYSLRSGPDLYAYFLANQDKLSGDSIHPSAAGYTAMLALWAEAMAFLY